MLWLFWIVDRKRAPEYYIFLLILGIVFEKLKGNKNKGTHEKPFFKFAQFAPGACSQIFNGLNIVEHFVGELHEIVGTHGRALLPERAPGSCFRDKIPRVYRP